MPRRSSGIVLLLALGLTAPALADDSGYFVVRLGVDTTSIEHYTRTADRLTIEQTGRAPRVLQRRFTYDYRKGALTHFSLVVTPPGSTTPTQTIETPRAPRYRAARHPFRTSPWLWCRAR
jgi:hypothetical protein